MNLRDTLIAYLTRYPRAFQSKVDCYDHLFCVIGNGYEWMGGELVEKPALLESQIMIEILLGTFKKIPPPSPEQIETALRCEEFTARFGGHHPPWVIDEYKKEKKGCHWYTLCEEYSKIYSIPPDIKPDWLEGARDCLRLMRMDGVAINESKLDPRLLR